MSCDAGDGGESEVGNAGSPILVDQDIRLHRWLGFECEDIHLDNNETYSFQISVDHTEIVHVLQAIRNAGQLDGASVGLLRDQVATYKLGAVCVLTLFNELVDVSVFHPLRNQSKSMLVQ